MERAPMDHGGIPGFLRACAETPPMQRLRFVGMNCGCEYTSLPRFAGLPPYSRYDHSLGVALIVWRFTRDRRQAAAGLLHDLASPVFAHVVDFLRGDYLKQESTEDGTEAMIAGSAELQAVLQKYGLTTWDVCDYHRYTIGNSVRFGFCTAGEAKRFCGALAVGTNERGDEELMFTNAPAAEAFAMAALACSRVYTSDEDRYAMQILSEILRRAIGLRVIREEELHATEPEVIRSLLSDARTAPLWERYRALRRIASAPRPGAEGCWRRIAAKKRYIDPMVLGRGRVSELSPAFADSLRAYLSSSQDAWLCGQP